MPRGGLDAEEEPRRGETGGTAGKGTAAPGPEQEGSKTEAGPGQKSQCCRGRGDPSKETLHLHT